MDKCKMTPRRAAAPAAGKRGASRASLSPPRDNVDVRPIISVRRMQTGVALLPLPVNDGGEGGSLKLISVENMPKEGVYKEPGKRQK